MTQTLDKPLITPGAIEFAGTEALLVDPEQVAAKIRRKKLSPSTMNALMDNSACGARFAADKLMPRITDPFSAAEIGTSAHHVLEHLFALPGPERTMEASLTILDKLGVKTFPLPPEKGEERDLAAALRKRWSEEVQAGYRGIFDIEDVSAVTPFKLEGWIGDGVEIEGVPISGIVDRIDRLPGGGLRPVDYKSGKVGNKRWGDPHGDQLRLYVMAAEAEYGILPEEAKVYYTKHSKSVPVSLTRPKLNQTRRKVAQAWDILADSCDTASFEVKASPLCGWCPLVNVCPAAAEAGKEAKIQAPSPVELGMEIPVRTEAAPSLSEGGEAAEKAAPQKKKKERNTPVARKNRSWREGKPWEEVVGGRLDPASYSAIAVFGLATRALSDIVKHNKALIGEPVEPVPVDRPTVTALAETYAGIIGSAQEELSNGLDWQAGLNTRLRSALFTATEAHSIPFGATLEEWDAWVERIVKNIVLLIEIGEDIYEGASTTDPLLALASDGEDYIEDTPDDAADDEPADDEDFD